MTGRGGALYTPDLLALAVSLADWPLDSGVPLMGESRSPTCGSTVSVGCALTDDGAIEAIGLRASACAVGQAAAALFVRSATGRTRDEIEAARSAIVAWLRDDGPLPSWPGLAVLDPARAFPARHGAVPLAWTAALAALPKHGAQS